jgi:hypothetical protein
VVRAIPVVWRVVVGAQGGFRRVPAAGSRAEGRTRDGCSRKGPERVREDGISVRRSFPYVLCKAFLQRLRRDFTQFRYCEINYIKIFRGFRSI